MEPGLRVALNPADDGGCGFYRIREPYRVLAEQGHDVHLITEPAVPADTDVCVLQRPLHRVFVEEAIPKLRAHGVAVVVEIDDDFDAIQQRNVSWKRVHPSVSPDRNTHWLGKACAAADLVTCTTPALARRYGAHKAIVLPNYVPEAYLSIERPAHDGVRVGWAGWTGTHPGDLDVLGDAVRRAQARTPFEFVAIGGSDTLDVLGVEGEYVPWTNLADYPRALATLDVGLVPLADNAFNRAKSALKLMEYAALGVEPIVSPTPDNLRMSREHALITVAERPREWQTAIRQAVRIGWETAHLRERMRGWTYEANAWRWLEAWDEARTRFLRRAA